MLMVMLELNVNLLFVLVCTFLKFYVSLTKQKKGLLVHDSRSWISKFAYLYFWLMIFLVEDCFCFTPEHCYSYTDDFDFMKVREAQLAQYNYILVVGEEESKTGQVIRIPLC